MKKPSRKLKIEVVLLNVAAFLLPALVILLCGSYVPKNEIELSLAFGLGVGLVSLLGFSIVVDVGYFFEYVYKKEGSA